MPRKRLPMRKINEVLRLKAAGLSVREIAFSTGAARTTVYEYLVRAAGAGLSWPLPGDIDEDALEQRLFPRPPPSWPSAGRCRTGGRCTASCAVDATSRCGCCGWSGNRTTPTVGAIASIAGTTTAGWEPRTW